MTKKSETNKQKRQNKSLEDMCECGCCDCGCTEQKSDH